MSKNRKIKDTSAPRREVVGVSGLGAALFLRIAMVPLQAHTMVMGPFGRSIASMFYGIAGVCGYFLIVLAAGRRCILDLSVFGHMSLRGDPRSTLSYIASHRFPSICMAWIQALWSHGGGGCDGH